ncbi:hypothetical protein NE237_006008 [Protea cynaroides]|uniref:Late embryogenesis abundant protein LEA-2 subgroup domain-containing protein n=1 Tax=Protea cynaroides TaxID=273540 RepID=A0A9Q0KM97_9MAGN|nr:hypothetical protein NE237_006008 [Protea cynaroides]
MKPSYTIKDVDIPALNILQKTQEKNTSILFRIQVLNPNRAFSILFYNINITLLYGDEAIGNTMFANIKQLKPTQTYQSVQLILASQSFWHEIAKLMSDGNLQVKVRLETRFKYRLLSFYHNIDREELDGVVPVGGDGKIVEHKQINLIPSCSWICKVHSFIWILLLLHLFCSTLSQEAL